MTPARHRRERDRIRRLQRKPANHTTARLHVLCSSTATGVPSTASGVQKMLWTIAVILLLMWALGLVTSFTASGLIHILLVLAIVVILIRVLQGRSAI